MADVELTRTPGDRRLYALEGLGTLRLQGFASRSATAEASGTSWRFARRGFWQRLIEATDAAGTRVGEFEPRSELAVLDGKAWGQRPVKVTIDDSEPVEPGLLLFAAFAVRGLAEDAAGAAGASASAATSG